MLKYFGMILTVLVFVLGNSCRKDFQYQNSAGNLQFSKDTVYLDTVFTNIGSSTYSFKVYNTSNTDIQIPSVRLGEGQESKYRLNVNGKAGKEFNNVPILAKDSMFVFVETTFDIAPTNESTFLYTDDILFDSGSLEQKVPLVTLVKDAVFLYPNTLANGTKETLPIGLDDNGNEIRVEGFVLEDNQLNFTNERPYVIYGYAAVTGGKTLTIEAGTRVHFHKDSGILVAQESSLKINGTLSMDKEVLENEVIFEGDRLEPEFSNVPGQWGIIWLARGSIANEINHLTIKNATVGILAEGNDTAVAPTLTIKNTQIYNSSNTNLWGRTATIVGENLVLGNAGVNALHCNLGGDYSFKHCTIANYWNEGFRTTAALQIDNFLNMDSSGSSGADLVQAGFTNCIIDGNTDIELFLNGNNSNTFNYGFTSCLIKFQDSSNLFANNPFYDFQNTTIYQSVVRNATIAFINTSKQDFRLLDTSAAIDLADPNIASEIPFDILGQDRTVSPDIGAYEYEGEN
ncbi:choice-of-anchor Q domain-containing protein [Costertonia aggregata]|uniref:Right-handed parallel beta-helix repeat-containing protein n=1 Tax=Costertonia aggregata TaxID=343403 RepID=A0A7H9AK22_9FLAO|nr:choice-of-anchor Q domain-containing protein [Costertonia aggregata]QLG43817.1 hypothetical protein HYG79_00110 [Costertonia aggregata]